MTTVLLHEGSAAPKLEPPPRPQVRAAVSYTHLTLPTILLV